MVPIKNKISNIFIGVLISFIFLTSGVLGANSITYCINETINYEKNIVIINNETYIIEENKTCNFGCDNTTGTCKPNPKETSLIIVIIPLVLILISFVLTYAGSTFSQEHGILQILFFTVALFFIIISSSILLKIAEDANKITMSEMMQGGYLAVIIILIFVVLYWFLMLIINAYNIMLKRYHK